MKTKPKSILSLLFLLGFTLFFTGCGETVISEDQMQERGDLVYTVNQESPFTGVVVKQYENGQKEWEKRYRDGVKVGTWTGWHENGQMSSERFYKDGGRDCKWTQWYENGQKMFESSMKDGLTHGKSVHWDENGQLRSEGSYKDGLEDGKWTYWNKDGRIDFVCVYKDGELIEIDGNQLHPSDSPITSPVSEE